MDAGWAGNESPAPGRILHSAGAVAGGKGVRIFVGALAFVSLATPYSALGSGLLFIRYVSSNPENFAVFWGNILFSTFGVGLLIAILLCFIAPHLLNPASASLILLVALGECICRQLVICISQVFQAYEQLRMTASITLLTSFLRLLAVGVLTWFLHHATAWQWALSSLIVSALAAIVAWAIVTARFGLPRSCPAASRALGRGLELFLCGSHNRPITISTRPCSATTA